MKGAKTVQRASQRCEECGSFSVAVTFMEGKSPFPDLFSSGCIFCENAFSALLYRL